MILKRFLFVLAFLLVGCVEGETAVPTMTMEAERPSSTATRTPNLPTAISTAVPSATVTPAPTNTLTLTPYPSTTPLPPLVWAEDMIPWSPGEAELVYRDNQENWRFLAVKDGRSTPITLSGGARLSAPQWSFDGRYLSMRVAGPEWGTAVIRSSSLSAH